MENPTNLQNPISTNGNLKIMRHFFSKNNEFLTLTLTLNFIIVAQNNDFTKSVSCITCHSNSDQIIPQSIIMDKNGVTALYTGCLMSCHQPS